ncbi:MAG: type II toxin-antitoxin system VapC family toxin [Synechococcus lacustris]
MTIVIDASMALAWVFERQQPSDRERADRLLASCGAEPWWVPGLWHLEVANALVVAERRAVIQADSSDGFLNQLYKLPIDTDLQPLADCQTLVLALARSHGLSSYDASYLALAQRLGATLASFDCKLIQAATNLGVPLLP